MGRLVGVADVERAADDTGLDTRHEAASDGRNVVALHIGQMLPGRDPLQPDHGIAEARAAMIHADVDEGLSTHVRITGHVDDGVGGRGTGEFDHTFDPAGSRERDDPIPAG